MATANKTPTGNPIANCLKNFFCDSLFFVQYSTNRLSSSFSIRKFTTLKGYLSQQCKIIILCLLKSDSLKLSPLLAQYLYLNKELNLSGIGKFRMEPIPELPDNIEKPSINEPTASISFQNDTSVKEDVALIEFISSQTGKMKSLASSDLDSYLELAKQFLNIGKPFLIEGIGTLTKNKSEKLDFTPGFFFNEKIKENVSEDTDQSSLTEESFSDYEEILSPKKPSIPFSRKIVLLLAVIFGIGLAIWGGYIIYKKTNAAEKPILKKTNTVLITDSVNNTLPDATILQEPASVTSRLAYKFVIEEADRNRAFIRYADLKNYGLDVMMETTDSITFKLFFKLAASPADTARIRDSLNIWYGTRSRTTIEPRRRPRPSLVVVKEGRRL